MLKLGKGLGREVGQRLFSGEVTNAFELVVIKNVFSLNKDEVVRLNSGDPKTGQVQYPKGSKLRC